MKRISIISLLFLLTAPLFAQSICKLEDKEILEKKFQFLKSLEKNSPMEMTTIGKTFMGTPYEAASLEVGDDHQVVVRLKGLDCTTFVESVLALSYIHRKESINYESYIKALELFRYRDGKMDGYASRLHYFTEWIRNNENLGLVKDLTAELGEEIPGKSIHFMGDHPKSYPALSNNDSMHHVITDIEKEINQHALYQIPIQKIASVESQIQDGDIIALVTSIDGLDVAHTGIAIEVNNRIHLLHASLSKKKVVITDKPLADWLAGSKRNTGILVVRKTF